MRTVTRLPRLKRRDPQAHKGSFGTVALLAGSDGMLGAAILAARGALRGGAGLVRACLPEALMAPFTVAVPAATTVKRTAALLGFLDQPDAVVVGPGLGQAVSTAKQVAALLKKSSVPMVLDADALNVLAPLPRTFKSTAPLVLTPHPGEARRLLGGVDVQADRPAAVHELVKRSGQVVVLKGAGTLVCDGQRLFQNRSGNPGMATGGSGDVLAGLLGALLAQGYEPFDAACLAVNIHGKAGDLVAQRLSQTGLTAEDLPLAIAEVMGV